jgi:putative CocE/NonD family hydrolase
MPSLWPAAAVLMVLIGGAAQPASTSFKVKANYTKFEFRVPMRDGQRLFTAVFVPKDQSRSYPFLLMRTPYGVAPYGAGKFPDSLYPGMEFARDGFIFVYQDVRGRGMSEGKWIEMTPEHDAGASPNEVDESTDTYDTIDWLLHHVANNNGKVGLVGISYPGFYASAGMICAHPALVAASPQAPIADLYMGDDAFHNGAFFLSANFSFYSTFKKQDHPQRLDKDEKADYGTSDGYKFYLKMGPIRNGDEKYMKYRNPYWTDLIAHPNYDSFWKQRNILPHVREIRPSVLVVGGWFDAEDLSGTLKTYRAIGKQSPETRRWLVMGPWFHGAWGGSDGASLGDISFGSKTAELFRKEVQLPFFAHYLKGAPDPNLPPAYVFETGTNQWRQYNEWPPAKTIAGRIYFREGKKLSFQAPSALETFDEYTSDPAQPVPYMSKPDVGPDRAYMDGDQRFIESRADVVSYVSDPLPADFTIAGPVSPSLVVSTTGTDSDFVVKLIDMYPATEGKLAGYEQLVRGEPFRGKFRHSFEKPEPFTPGKPETIQFTMPDVNHCFRRGHRIMVQIQSSWFPLVDRNPQTFVDIPGAAPTDFRKAVERVYHSAERTSYVEMNVMR